MSETETITLSEVITEEEYCQLVAYLNALERWANADIRDWLGTQPAVLERMNKHQLLLSYFAYLLQSCLQRQQP